MEGVEDMSAHEDMSEYNEARARAMRPARQNPVLTLTVLIGRLDIWYD